MGLKSYNGGGDGAGVGEIVEVQGGHIIRATGRKDRHSKVFTSKGPRDRRVRLSAHTAIQFYDVQDRLGYDRPSKAVDWLIKKAKSAIDKLEISTTTVTAETTTLQESSKPGSSSSEANLHNQTQFETTPLMSTFFPVTSGITNSNINFESYNNDLVSRTTSNLGQSQDNLGLSLHTFQGNTTSSASDHHHHQATLFTTPFETNSFGRFYNDLASSEQSRNGFLVNHQQPSMMTLLNSQQQPQQLFLGGQQRGTLQSSFHSWDHHHNQHQHQHQHHHHNETVTDQNQASSVMFASQFGGHSHGMIMQGLSFQSRIHGDGGQATPQPNSSSSPPN